MVQQPCAPAEKSVNTMSSLLLTVSDWLIVMIGPGGLLLVAPHLFAVPDSVLWVRLQEKYITKLGCEIYFCRVAYSALLRYILGITLPLLRRHYVTLKIRIGMKWSQTWQFGSAFFHCLLRVVNGTANLTPWNLKLRCSKKRRYTNIGDASSKPNHPFKKQKRVMLIRHQIPLKEVPSN